MYTRSYPPGFIITFHVFPSFPTANTGASAQAVLAAIAAGETDFTLVGVPRDPFRREKGHEGGVYACCFSRNGERFATVSRCL